MATGPETRNAPWLARNIKSPELTEPRRTSDPTNAREIFSFLFLPILHYDISINFFQLSRVTLCKKSIVWYISET